MFGGRILDTTGEFKDVDGIRYLFEIFFLGHLFKMLGIASPLADKYEEEMAKHTVTLDEDD